MRTRPSPVIRGRTPSASASRTASSPSDRHTRPEHQSLVLVSKVVNGEVVIVTPIGGR